MKHYVQLSEYVSRNHKEKLKALRLFYWIKDQNLGDSNRINIKQINLYKSNHLKDILRIGNKVFWDWDDNWTKNKKQWVYLYGLKRICQALDYKPKRILVREDISPKTYGDFSALVTKSIAEIGSKKRLLKPIGKNKLNKKIKGRAKITMATRLGISESSVKKHLKKAGAKSKSRFSICLKKDYRVADYDSHTKVYKAKKDILIVDHNELQIPSGSFYKVKIKRGLKKGLYKTNRNNKATSYFFNPKDHWYLVRQLSNHYLFTGIKQYCRRLHKKSAGSMRVITPFKSHKESWQYYNVGLSPGIVIC